METDGNGRSQPTLHSTPSTAEPGDWVELLSTLTDDELRRYREIALDQRDLEYDKWWAQIALWLAAIAALAWGLWQMMEMGVTSRALTALVAAGAFAYWPYRKVKMRRLWKGHCEAVAQELARRVAKAD
jgi:hypothetical protein